MPIRPYLNFDGYTKEVVEYYADVFKTDKPHMMTFGQMHGAEIPPGTENLIMHAQLIIAGTPVLFSDAFPGMPLNQGNNFSLAIVSDDEQLLKDAFHQLKEGGNVTMELQETPWSKVYGYLTDKYGVGWQFNLEKA